MKPGKKNIELVRGDFYSLFFRVRAGVWVSETESWVPGDYKDLTGYSVASQIRLGKDTDAQLSATFACSLGDQDTFPGSVYIFLTEEQTKGLVAPPQVPKNTYQWDVELTDTDGHTRTYLAGSVSVLPSTTSV